MVIVRILHIILVGKKQGRALLVSLAAAALLDPCATAVVGCVRLCWRVWIGGNKKRNKGPTDCPIPMCIMNYLYVPPGTYTLTLASPKQGSQKQLSNATFTGPPSKRSKKGWDLRPAPRYPPTKTPSSGRTATIVHYKPTKYLPSFHSLSYWFSSFKDD